jgi:hypothetical protein
MLLHSTIYRGTADIYAAAVHQLKRTTIDRGAACSPSAIEDQQTETLMQSILPAID